ncbi:MAG: hypothetical protein BGN93_01320 [Acinetobacter sp. 39-4]|nr:MAG: hypothetical protein BGN93_01320 [Acinetobacter sp. 39-4]OJU98901.1 MAG: hypothetical protein BGO19_05780 [Acinetobacter sp. 38-8]
MLHEQPYAKSLSYKNVAIVGEFRPKKRKDCWTCLAKETIQTRLCYSAERFFYMYFNRFIS